MAVEAEGRGHSSDRREFLKTLAAGALAAGLAPEAGAAEAGAVAGPSESPGPLPQITIAGHRIPRMVVGCNPIGGWSHQVHSLTLAMTEYYDQETTQRFLRQCEKQGLDLWISYWDDKPLKALRTIRAEGSRMRCYFMGTLGEDGKLQKEVLEHKPLFFLHHGNATDDLFRAGKHQQVHDFVKRVHDEMGVATGVSCHNPDCVKYMEDKGWEVDLYQCCLYYLTRPKDEIRAKLGGAMLGESFLDTDRDNMLKVVRQASKPCFVFKILGAGWHCGSDGEVEDAFRVALQGIKKTDGIIVGMWPKFKDEITQNVGFLRKYGS
ncbi:MAG TPA: hypothetical protein VGN26_18730, partial [Armatimonadota bacterium]